MSNVYQAMFRYPAAEGQLETIRTLTLEWASAPTGLDRSQGLSRHEWLRGNVTAGVEIIDQTASADPAWACRLSHPSPYDPEQFFVVEVTATQVDELCQFGVRVEVEDRAPVFRPARVTPDPPRLVRMVANAFGDTGSHELHQLNRKNVPLFMQRLTAANRAVPLVVISLRNWEGTSFFPDPGQIASRLAGVAGTWIYADKLVERDLKEHMSERHTAGDGAVRIYWPRWSPDDDPFAHHLFTPKFIHNRRKFVRGLERWMANEVTAITGRASRRGVPTWSAMLAANHRREIDSVRDSGTDEELIRLLEEDNTKLELERDQFQDALAEAEQEIYNLRNRLAAVRGQPAGATESELVDDGFEATSIEDMVAHAEERYAERVVLALNSASDVDAPFKDIGSFQKAFVWLCTDFVAWKRNERPGVNYLDLQQELKARCGFDFKTGQSKTTLGKYRSDYETTHDDRRFEITEHIGWGNKASNRPIRVAFAWDDVTQRLVIGYVGPHQRTSASN